MTLREVQVQFAANLPELIKEAFKLGYEVTLGEAFRPQEWADAYAKQGRGVVKSAHTERRAIDLNLFTPADGDKPAKYITSTEAHRPLGEFWESLGGIWGGRFSKPDGNHYEWPRKGVEIK